MLVYINSMYLYVIHTVYYIFLPVSEAFLINTLKFQ